MWIVRNQMNGLSRLPITGKCAPSRKARPFSLRPLTLVVTSVFALLLTCGRASATVTLTLSSATGGILIGGTSPTYTSGFGNVNGLGVGTPGTGVTVLTTGVSGGVLYITNYNIVISGLYTTRVATVAAYVSTNFTHPTTLILESCYPSTSCASASSFTTLSTSAATPTTIIPAPGVGNGTYTASLGLFVSNANGAAVSGAETATITFVATQTSNGRTSTVTLALNNPSETVQTAVSLLLATAAGGLTISPASNYSMNFGNVNGLGIGPSAGLSVVSSAGGVIYSTPYLLEPTFSSFASTTGSLEVYVSTNFVNPAILELEEAAASAGPYTVISTSSAAPTSITTTASSGSSLTEYLGLFVSAANGATAFTGSDSATLTYIITVP